MNQNNLAVQHYQWVLAYGKDPTLRYYAQVACQNLAYFKEHSNYQGQGAVPRATAYG